MSARTSAAGPCTKHASARARQCRHLPFSDASKSVKRWQPHLVCRSDPADKSRATDILEKAEVRRRSIEDELRDPKNFVEYLLPRPLRILFFGGSAASCLIAALLSAVRLVKEPALAAADGAALQDLVVNAIGMATFGALFVYDRQAGEARIEQRKVIRQAQIEFGDREVYVNEQGEKMSRLKEVNDDWIMRRLERWGRRDGMPFVGPEKAALLQGLVQQVQPRLVVEVGTMAGYSAIAMAQVLPPGSRVISIEKELSWVLVAKRFLWQASQGSKAGGAQQKVGDKVDVWWGDAKQKLSQLPAGQQIDLLFLDGIPKDTLQYLQAAEPFLAPGATVVADNAVVFAQGGMRPYLEYVRGGGRYSSSTLGCKLEWREDVEDGLEVSRLL